MNILVRYAALAACLLSSAALVGCEDGRTRPPSVSTRVLHAIPDRGPIAFLRVEWPEVELDFRQTTNGALQFDSDEYDFSVELNEPNVGRMRVATITEELVPDHNYLFVLTENEAGEHLPIVLEKPNFEGPGAEITVLNAAPSLGELAIHIVAEGVDPSTVAPTGTAAYPNNVPSQTFDPGLYQMIVTAADDPTSVLLSSETFPLLDSMSLTFVLIEPAPDTFTPMTVAVLDATSPLVLLFDDETESVVQVINAAADTNPRDVYLNEDFSAPLIAAAPYGVPTPYTPIPFGTQSTSVTPAGSTNVIEAEDSSVFVRARHQTLLIAGEPGEIRIATNIDNRRPLRGSARLRFIQAATNVDSIEFFLAEAGTEIDDDDNPTSELVVPEFSPRSTVPVGDYELWVRDPTAETFLVEALPITLEQGVYTVLALNGAEPGSVDLRFLEDFE